MFVPADVLLRKAGIVRRRGRSGHMLAADMRGGSQPAIAWLQLNSNCGDHSGRTKAVQAIMDLGLVPVHAFGPCLRNQNVTERIASKSDLFRNYKFCVAMENSIEGAADRVCRPFLAEQGSLSSVSQRVRPETSRHSTATSQLCRCTECGFLGQAVQTDAEVCTPWSQRTM